MATITNIKWEEVKLDYLAGIKTKDLAEKYQVDYGTLANKISKDGWYDLLNENILKFNKLYIEEQANSDLEAIRVMKNTEREHADLISKAIVSKLVKDGEIDSELNTSDINNLTSSLEKVQKIKYKSYGISDKLELDATLNLPPEIKVKFV